MQLKDSCCKGLSAVDRRLAEVGSNAFYCGASKEFRIESVRLRLFARAI